MQGFGIQLWVGVNGAGDSHAAHVQQIHKVGEPPQLGILFPGHLQASESIQLPAGCMRWRCFVMSAARQLWGIATGCQPTADSSTALVSLLARSPWLDVSVGDLH